jgi:TetR/AcrR family transcriptional repressor of mexJK operon
MVADPPNIVAESRPQRGRPRDPSKRQALVDAARALFIAHGFDPVTIDQVIAAARVSRATFYGYFHDKGALLEAMCSAESKRIGVDDFPDEAVAEDVVGSLATYGERLLGFLVDPEMLALERLIASVSRDYPDLGRRMFAAGPGRGRDTVKRIIGAAQERGLVGACDLDEAAADLSGLWQGMLRVELNFGERDAPGPQELRGRAERGVAQFLKLYGPASPSRN